MNCLFPFRMISLKDQVQPRLFNYSRFNKLTNTMYKYVQPSITGADHFPPFNCLDHIRRKVEIVSMKFAYQFPPPFTPNPRLQKKPHPSCADLGILTVFGL